MNLFSLLIIILSCLLPIVFWGYIFSYIDATLANRKRFLFGIVAGILSTLPILYLGKMGGESIFHQVNLFETISRFDYIRYFPLIIGFIVIIGMVSISGYFLGLFQKSLGEQLKTIARNIAVFVLGSALLGGVFILLYVFFEVFPLSNLRIADGVSFGNFLFNSLKLVIFYYLVIGFIEETSKHFHFLSGSLPSIKNTKEIVLLSVFIALGFSFMENIVYLWTLYGQYGFSWELVKIYVFRSCFSLMLHVICSALLAHVFSLVWYEKRFFSFVPLGIFLSGILLSVVFHSVFDISLSLGLGFVPFLYFLGGYLYVSSIFYKDVSSSESDT